MFVPGKGGGVPTDLKSHFAFAAHFAAQRAQRKVIEFIDSFLYLPCNNFSKVLTSIGSASIIVFAVLVLCKIY